MIVDFGYPQEIAEFAATVERFARKRLADGALARAHSPKYPREIARELAAQGLFGIAMPENLGGQGGDLLAAVVAIQSVARACPRSADVVQAGNFGAVRTFAEYANASLREEYLDGLMTGELLISLSMTEPQAGSATTDMVTTARAVPGGYRVSGSKIFGTHSPEADLYLVYLRFGPGVGGIGSVILARDTEGLTVGTPSRFLSGEQWAELNFDDCFVPESRVLLGPGGFKRQMAGFNVERLGNCARSIAVGRYAFDTAVDYLNTREQFGRPLAEFQGLQWMMVDAAVALESAQLLLLRAIPQKNGELPAVDDTAMAKLAANQAGYQAANAAMQALGGHGFSEESLVEYCFRRTRGWMIAGGSVEMMRNRVAESVFGRRFSQRAVAVGDRR